MRAIYLGCCALVLMVMPPLVFVENNDANLSRLPSVVRRRKSKPSVETLLPQNDSSSSASAPVASSITAVDGNWTRLWFKQKIKNEDPPRIYFIHVGKTGGMSLQQSIPLDLDAKRTALACLMQRMDEQRNKDKDSVHQLSFFSFLPKTFLPKRHPQPPLSLEQAWNSCYHFKQPRPRDAKDEDKVKHEPALARRVYAQKHTSLALYTHQQQVFLLQHMNTFCITARSPVARIVSAFNYHRNLVVSKLDAMDSDNEVYTKNKSNNTTATDLKKKKTRSKKSPAYKMFYLQCFETIQQVVEALLLDDQDNTTTNTTTQECVDLAQTILQGKGPPRPKLDHFFYNYQYYVQNTMDQRPTVPVVVVRTDFLWQDAAALDVALGGDGHFVGNKLKFQAWSHGRDKYAIQQVLSSSSSQQGQAICCQIWNDIVAYQRIIQSAINLTPQDKQMALNKAREECGVTTTTTGQHYETVHTDNDSGDFSWSRWHEETCRRRLRAR